MNKKLLFSILVIATITCYIINRHESIKPAQRKLLGSTSRSYLQSRALNARATESYNSQTLGHLADRKDALPNSGVLSATNEATQLNKIRKESNGIVIHLTAVTYNDSALGTSAGLESKGIIFVSDYDSSKISVCRRRLDGTFNCQAALSGLYGPENILVIHNKLYITNLRNSSITVCEIAINGNINKCNNVAIGLKNPVNLFYSNQQLFISDMTVKATEACQIDANGDIISCDKVTGILPALFKTVNYNGYNYSTDWTNNAIDKCINMYSTACTKITDARINGPLTIRILNNSAYIANCSLAPSFEVSCGDVHSVIQCAIQSSGDFYNCQVVSDAFMLPTGIAEYLPASPQSFP